MKYLTCALLLIALIPALISAFPSTVVINGRCLTCPNPDGDRVVINGQEYRSWSTPDSNVVVSPGSGSYSSNGRSTVIQRGGNTVVNGRCRECNVDY